MGQGSSRKTRRRKLELPKDQEFTGRNVWWDDASPSSPRAPFAACLFFSRRGVRSLWKSCPLLSSKKKKGKRRKKRNRDSTLNRSMEVHDPARLQPLIHSRPHSLCFLLSATRFERPDDDFTRYPLLYFCFGLSLSLSMSAVTR